GRGKRRLGETKVGGQKGKQIIGGEGEGACSGQRGQVPVFHLLKSRIVTDSQPCLHFRRECDCGALHAQWSANFGKDQGFVVFSGAPGQDVSQQPAAQVRVFITRTNVAAKLISGEKLIQLLH